jgi:hypothetical protein
MLPDTWGQNIWYNHLPMKKPTGIDWKHVTFVTGQHVDHLPATLPQQLFKRPCGNCGADTYTEIVTVQGGSTLS